MNAHVREADPVPFYAHLHVRVKSLRWKRVAA